MSMARERDVLLEVKNLRTHFMVHDGVVKAVDGVDFTIARRKTLCIVGESGCGKSATAHSILRLVEEPGRIVGGEILFHRNDGSVVDLAALKPHGREIRAIRGAEISMVFQEPMSSLSPIHRVGDQVTEAMLLHLPIGKREAHERAVDLLARVGIPNPQRHMDSYPYELSGGMRQRVSLAAALSCGPELLIADEPTTALDVTTQAQILELLAELQEEMGMAIVFITHDLGVVAAIADEVVVMYLGIVAEQSDVDSLFHEPRHPYTRALLDSIPKPGRGRRRLAPIMGSVPSPYERPAGCPFHPRCDAFMAGICDTVFPPVVAAGPRTDVRCLLYTEEVTANGSTLQGSGALR